jgi:hypothetical protein
MCLVVALSNSMRDPNIIIAIFFRTSRDGCLFIADHFSMKWSAIVVIQCVCPCVLIMSCGQTVRLHLVWSKTYSIHPEIGRKKSAPKNQPSPSARQNCRPPAWLIIIWEVCEEKDSFVLIAKYCYGRIWGRVINCMKTQWKLPILQCYHLFSISRDPYLAKNYYEHSCPQMVPMAKILGLAHGL